MQSSETPVSAAQPEKAAELKQSGDMAFKQEHYGQAITAYTQALEQDAANSLLWANRSAAYLKEGKARDALDDARQARTLNPKYMKVCAMISHERAPFNT